MKTRAQQRFLDATASNLFDAAGAHGNGAGIVLPEEVDGITRRQLLRSGVSVTAFTSLSALLGAGAARGQDTSTGTSTATETYAAKKKLIWIQMDGAWDILEITDPKVASTSGIDMMYTWDESSGVANSSDGARIGRFIPGIASLGKDLLVVRGLAMGTTNHLAGKVYMDTGILSNAGPERVNAASIPAIVASESDATIPIIQLQNGADPKTDRGLLKPVSAVRAGNLELYRAMYPQTPAAIDRKIAVLEYLKNSVTRLEASVGKNDRLTALATAESKVRNQFATNVGAKLAVDATDRAQFAAGQPTGAGMANMMSTANVDAIALTLKLINSDIVTCVNLGFGGFDTHQGQTARLQPILAGIDFLITRLVEGLRASGKLNDTLIVMYSDFGRTPKVNGGNGRDHWPTGGALVMGGGIDGGRAVGATDDNLQPATFVNPDSGTETTDSAVGTQLNPTHVGGMVVSLCLGSEYSKYRPYLPALPSMIRTK